MKPKTQQTVKYRWVVCGMCALMLFVTMGTGANLVSVFLPYIRDNFNMTNAQSSSLLTVRCVFSFLTLFFLNRYYDAVSLRTGTAVSVAMIGVAYIIYACSSTYISFCIGSVIMGIGYSLGSIVPASVLMTRWFDDHKALAISIACCGSGAASMTMPMILTSLIVNHSLRHSLAFTAGYSLFFAVIIFIFIRDRNDRPADSAEASASEHSGTAPQSENYTAKGRLQNSAAGSKSFRLMFVSCILIGCICTAGFNHVVILFTSEGFSPTLAALVFSIMSFTMTVFKIIEGQVTDILGGLRASLIFCSVLLAANVLCCFAFVGSVPLIFAAGILLGIGFPITSMGAALWAKDISSEADFPETVRKLQLAFSIGSLAYSNVPGILADVTGTYVTAYVTFVFMTAVLMVLVTRSYRSTDNKL